MNLLEELQASVVCGDGAMGTELMGAGVPMEVCLEEVNLTDPDVVRRIHEAYIAAGSRVIETNTFGANSMRLAKHGLESKVRELNMAAVAIAKRASSGKDVCVAASVGPLGIANEEVRAQKIDQKAIFQEQISALLEADVHAIFLETFLDLEEIKIALQALRQLSTEIPVICSMVCSEEGRLPSSLPVVQAFRELSRLGANVVGVNCVTGPRAMVQILKRIPLDFVISAYPNAGYPRYQEGRFIYNAFPEYFAKAAKEFVAEGARLIGGCCGVGPQHIQEMSKALVGLEPVKSKPVIKWLAEPEPIPEKRPVETSLLDLIAGGHTVIVTELDPPKTLDLDRYFTAARHLADAGSDAITLAD
ncbi:MAG TPA: homocysteine S-methyltransferase family protein, partial [Chthoniobacterales bacterium]|nr:homocysteine S-methyltransferase family protein [Chthoniobacterales bacterium]